MKSGRDYIDLSKPFVTTTTTRDRIPSDNAQLAASEVYNEFSGGSVVHDHLIDLAAALRPDIQLSYGTKPALTILKRFGYLHEEVLHRNVLRLKGVIAINMVFPEFYDGDLSAELVEPFKGIAILPTLYKEWKRTPRFK